MSGITELSLLTVFVDADVSLRIRLLHLGRFDQSKNMIKNPLAASYIHPCQYLFWHENKWIHSPPTNLQFFDTRAKLLYFKQNSGTFRITPEKETACNRQNSDSVTVSVKVHPDREPGIT